MTLSNNSVSVAFVGTVLLMGAGWVRFFGPKGEERENKKSALALFVGAAIVFGIAGAVIVAERSSTQSNLEVVVDVKAQVQS